MPNENAFTPNYQLPLEVQGHVAQQESFKSAMLLLDSKIKELDDRITALEP